MKKSDELKARLAGSLDRTRSLAETFVGEAAGGAEMNNDAAESALRVENAVSLQPEKKRTGKRHTPITLSLYDADLAHLMKITGFVLQKGIQISRSDAARLAIRSVNIDDGLIQKLEEIRKDDGRR